MFVKTDEGSAPVSAEIGWTGVVRFIHVAPRAFLPMRSMSAVTLIAGKGIEGDRYMMREGFYSGLRKEGDQITLFEYETLLALKRDAGIEFAPEEHRRNVTVEGVPLNHLVGRRFWLGETILEGVGLVEPCRHLETVTGKTISKHLINRGGIYCKILQSGMVRVGDRARRIDHMDPAETRRPATEPRRHATPTLTWLRCAPSRLRWRLWRRVTSANL